ncbi:NAD-dependent epimerase/dehydratase family protein [Ktedonosporobacter rubrisoli]|uniref:NAD-dependent epimerase/dehydratase family protein n=1 Tax=Ktedonosporobacter rubrisoli TaxID=2509675 RepID=A0A4V0YZM0_KTERU|nr:NmrA family NAD(P)-binding protein [Ktedonosporobacter rubrisoli]QBD80191.1 NAD-dependent epimerase/dehydratase family protein [Ktedonosporobacter rubrisoli]
MSTILITGATGTLGSEVVQQLHTRGHHVRAYTRQVQPAVPMGVEVFQGDIRDGSGLDKATKGVDAIIHCATFFGEVNATDLAGTSHLIEAAQAHGAPHLIYVSIAGIDHSQFSYFQAKLAVERLIEQSTLPWSILRVTQFHHYILSLIKDWEDEQTSTITVPAGTRLQPIDIREVAAALIELAEQEAAGHVPDIGGPEILTIEEIVETYQRVLNKKRVIRAEGPEVLPGEYYDAFRSDEKLIPDRAVAHITWERFLQERVEKLVG